MDDDVELNRRGELANDDTLNWRVVAATSQLGVQDAIQVVVDGVEIAIYKVGESFYATSGSCTHAQARLCDGYVEGDVIECPLHAGRFHIPTGKAIGPPATENLKVYPLKVVGSDIFIQLA